MFAVSRKYLVLNLDLIMGKLSDGEHSARFLSLKASLLHSDFVSLGELPLNVLKDRLCKCMVLIVALMCVCM